MRKGEDETMLRHSCGRFGCSWSIGLKRLQKAPLQEDIPWLQILLYKSNETRFSDSLVLELLREDNVFDPILDITQLGQARDSQRLD
jgi:hypothetical protein